MIIDQGLKIIELEFPDGSNPPKSVIKQWLKIVKDHFGSPEELKKTSNEEAARLSSSYKGPKGIMKHEGGVRNEE